MPEHRKGSTPKDPGTLPYGPCVGIMLINRDGLVWAGNRIQEVDTGSPLTWQMPQGGIDDGEDARTAAFREMKEEIGTDKARIIGETKDWLTYDLPAHLVGIALKGKYRGQKQKWFAMRFTGKDKHNNIDVPHPEFDSWRWNDLATLPDLIVPFKRPVYLQISAEFHDVPQRIREMSQS